MRRRTSPFIRRLAATALLATASLAAPDGPDTPCAPPIGTTGAIAGVDGEIIEKIPIPDFEALEEYIRTTESREPMALDPTRFEYLDDVDVYGLTYWSDSLRVKGFLLTPKAGGPFPSIIYNRGGSLEWGSLTHSVSSVGLGELAEIARAGYVVVASQYRGNGGGEGYEEYMGRDLNDVLNLIPLLEQVPESDASRIGMFGWSRGGATTFQVLKRTDRIQAAVVGSPATDYVRIINEDEHFFTYWSEFIPGFLDDPDETMRRRSVLYWVDELPRDVPLLVLHGTADRKVTTGDMVGLVSELDEHGIPFRMVMYEGGDHAISQYREEAFGQIVDWFDRYLTAGEEAPR